MLLVRIEGYWLGVMVFWSSGGVIKPTNENA